MGSAAVVDGARYRLGRAGYQRPLRRPRATSRGSAARQAKFLALPVLWETRTKDEGFVEDVSTDRLVLYKQIPGRPLRFVLVRPIDDTYAAIRAFEQVSVRRFAAVLAVITVIAGVAIWLIIGAPMRTLALAVQRFGTGRQECARRYPLHDG